MVRTTAAGRPAAPGHRPGRGRRRTARSLLLLCCAAPALLGAATGTAAAAAAAVPATPFDVDGNGYADLVVGAPGEDIGAVADAGSVTVTLCGAAGVATRSFALSQSLDTVAGAAEPDDGYGTAIASGDFDRDGYADLAVGVPGEAVGTVAGAGAVSVLYGAATYPGTRNQFWSQDNPGIPGINETADGFGTAVAVGDVDGDGYADLAVADTDFDGRPDTVYSADGSTDPYVS